MKRNLFLASAGGMVAAALPLSRPVYASHGNFYSNGRAVGYVNGVYVLDEKTLYVGNLHVENSKFFKSQFNCQPCIFSVSLQKYSTSRDDLFVNCQIQSHLRSTYTKSTFHMENITYKFDAKIEIS